jgi:hypothetical protein
MSKEIRKAVIDSRVTMLTWSIGRTISPLRFLLRSSVLENSTNIELYYGQHDAAKPVLSGHSLTS